MSNDFENNYHTIYDKIACIRCSEEALKNMKSRFDVEINSRRRLDSIKTLAELLRILEKRDCLSPSNVEPLIEIAVALNQTSVLQPINGDSAYNNTSQSYSQEYDEYSVLPSLPRDSKRRAYNAIETDIGQKWQDFARALNIPEGQIDDLSNTHKAISQRVREILRFHEENCDKRLWRSTLLSALREARRSDLSNKIQYIFDTCP